MEDFEQLGAFYLGRRYDLTERKQLDEALLYDARHLTTHALCVGMTGSGKTGLCIDLLEEAAIDGIPAIAIDPKGDIANLLLSFPDAQARDFLPWIDTEEAARQGQSAEAFAEKVAAAHVASLQASGQDVARIRRFREACELSVYTPGSSAGLELSLLRGFDAPAADVLEDAELFAGKIEGAVSGLLGLLDIEADPLRSREHVLLSQIFSQAWSAGQSLDLTSIIAAIRTPPFKRVGALELEAFFPSKERGALAALVNSLLASPAAASWARGEALDIARLLRTPAGKPRISILSIAHLPDAQRMFFVTLLLDEVRSWMRRQTGTSSLRALLYMDEIFGYFPPTASPPSKRPMLSLLKQARAFGLGVVLATQNPADLDYKGLANCGTWFLGRLQTERDKLRVLEGLEGAARGANRDFDTKAVADALSSLEPRVFLLNDVREAAPSLFRTRPTLSFLRGPLSREELKILMAPQKAAAGAPTTPTALPTSAPLTSALPTSAPLTSALPTNAPPATSAPAASPKVARPRPPAELAESFLQAEGDGPFTYQPALAARGKVRFVDAKRGVDHVRDYTFALSLNAEAEPLARGGQVLLLPSSLGALATAPQAGADFADLPELSSKRLTAAQKALAAHAANLELELLACPALALIAAPEEDRSAFQARVDQRAREVRDEAVSALRAKYDPKFQQLKSKLEAADAKLAKERGEATSKQLDTAAAVGGALLGALFGRSAFSAGTVQRGAAAARSAVRAKKESGDVGRAEEAIEALRGKWTELQAEANAQLSALQSNAPGAASVALAETRISARKADIQLGPLTLLWLPVRTNAAGESAYACSFV